LNTEWKPYVVVVDCFLGPFALKIREINGSPTPIEGFLQPSPDMAVVFSPFGCTNPLASFPVHVGGEKSVWY